MFDRLALSRAEVIKWDNVICFIGDNTAGVTNSALRVLLYDVFSVCIRVVVGAVGAA